MEAVFISNNIYQQQCHGRPIVCHGRPIVCHGRPIVCHGRPIYMIMWPKLPVSLSLEYLSVKTR